LKIIRVGEQIKRLKSTSFHKASIEISMKKIMIRRFSSNCVKNRSRNHTKKNKESKPEPELCQNGTVPQHWKEDIKRGKIQATDQQANGITTTKKETKT
jgi:hypothetical protein